MSPKVIPMARMRAMAWKNGGGTTREIAVFPPGAGMGDFIWRLSMATVEQAGPFSAFPGIERTLAVLDGRLSLVGQGLAAELDAASAPLCFDAALPVHGSPLGGPVRDLNAMVRRGACTVSMERLTHGSVVTGAPDRFLVALEDQTCDGIRLKAGDCVVVTQDLRHDGPALLVTFTPNLSCPNPA